MTEEERTFEDEDALERAACEYAEARGVCTLKVTAAATDNEDGWPDRLFFGRTESGVRVVFLVEFKAFGETPRKLQRVTQELIRRRYRVHVYNVDRWSRWLRAWECETGLQP